jgi:hypothetical protein
MTLVDSQAGARPVRGRGLRQVYEPRPSRQSLATAGGMRSCRGQDVCVCMVGSLL